MKNIAIIFTTPEIFPSLKTIIEEKDCSEATLFDITQIKTPLFSVDELNKINYAEEIFISFDEEKLEPFKQELANVLILRHRNKKSIPNFYIIYKKSCNSSIKKLDILTKESKKMFLKNLLEPFLNSQLMEKFNEKFSETRAVFLFVSKKKILV